MDRKPGERVTRTRRRRHQTHSLGEARRAATTHAHDYVQNYVQDLGAILDLDVIRDSKVRMGVDPLGGAGVHYWPRIAERYRLD